MLALTPAPLQTPGERALFDELTRWDTGASVRAAVVASIPLVDGPMQRRLSDAVLFVPEGIAVVRIVEVLRQSGVVTAVPEGAWSIAAESGPSQVLAISGGGSSPLDGLMRAGMDTAMKLRRAGLEPGRIARFTVLVGDVTGLAPADGDLGEGDQVARLEPRSLLLGIARASRYTGVDNPRLWTTADVRAALEALGLEGRGPSVEELNGEGFPYSPYVLRRPQLLTPAAMAASPAGAAASAVAPMAPEAAPPVATTPAPAVREQPSAAAIAQAVAASAAAAHAAGQAVPPAPPKPQPEPQALRRDTAAIDAPPEPLAVRRDTAAIDVPPGPPAPLEDSGIGGLFAAGEPEAGPQPERRAPDRRDPAGPPRTSVFPQSAPQAVAPPPVYWSQSPQGASAFQPEAPERGTGGRTALLIVAAVLLVVVVLAAGLLLFLRGQDDPSSDAGTAAGSSAVQAAPAGPEVGDTQVVGGVEFTVQAVDLDDTCVGHAYGETATFFATSDCAALSRALYSAMVDGQPVVVSVSRVQMPDTAAARSLQALTDRTGSGNVNDLLREGVRYTGSPAELSGAEYASAVSGAGVTIVESAWVDEDSGGSSDRVDEVAEAALALPVQPFPGE
ncbi:MAG: hypothetical protein AVDCRST_MAG57-1225 [uncultured Blastococcus sp.]|uniref:Uncharacterized protein n=1 Tax=uncultured Blastococcus sp. TaxID=217144 RepID=A0A6J4HVW8_9ACTN|nr:MAG: hypothetical protein AVDCRST_MAG57-1225 [uncultured Blastococcus sp.]